MKNPIHVAAVCCGLSFLVSCAPSLHVTSDYDRSVNFQPYKTFALVIPEPQDESISQLNIDRIHNAVKAEMTKKGFIEDATKPDLKVSTVVVLKDKKEVTANTDYYGYGGFYRPFTWSPGMGSGVTTQDVKNFTNGSLIIDVVDAKGGHLIWEGIGNQEIDAPVKDPDKLIPATVTKIMAGFPPGATSK